MYKDICFLILPIEFRLNAHHNYGLKHVVYFILKTFNKLRKLTTVNPFEDVFDVHKRKSISIVSN